MVALPEAPLASPDRDSSLKNARVRAVAPGPG
jgi:hypothetical protein